MARSPKIAFQRLLFATFIMMSLWRMSVIAYSDQRYRTFEQTKPPKHQGFSRDIMGFLKTRATRWFLLLALFFIFGSITTALIMWFSPETLYRCLDGILGVHWPELEADIDLGLDEPLMPPQEGIELQPMAPRRPGQD